MQQTNILWSGVQFPSFENCVISREDTIVIDSAIVGRYDAQLYRAHYQLRLNPDWQVYRCSIQFQCDNEHRKFEFEKRDNQWMLNGKHIKELDNCLYPDIPLTPLTNTMPINHLNLAIGQHKIIDVMYIDLPQNTITPVQQKYTRTSADTYKYENVPNDFEALIKIDADGYVVDYPGLYKMEEKVISSYPLL